MNSSVRTWKKRTVNSILKVEKEEVGRSKVGCAREKGRFLDGSSKGTVGENYLFHKRWTHLEKVKREFFPSNELGKYGGVAKETGGEP